jgi:hypothetical protein
MENALRTIIATNHVPSDLVITYDDTHGLWGGRMLTVRGDGSLERQSKAVLESLLERENDPEAREAMAMAKALCDPTLKDDNGL